MKTNKTTRDEIWKWLRDYRFNTWTTVTLRQGIHEARGWVRIDRNEAAKVATLLADRLNKALLGTSRARAGKAITFIPFIEDGRGDKRLHLHICVDRPADIGAKQFETIFRSVAGKLKWVHSLIDVTSVAPGKDNEDRLLQYCLKEGADALCVEACHLPEISRLVGS